MGVCEQCTYFRRLRPASQLLAAVFSTTDAAVSGALSKVVEDEQKQRESEAEYKRAQATADREEWATKPVMSDFCGFREAEGVFLIAEVKNRGGQCQDFVAGRPDRHACAECRHRVVAGGPAKDLIAEEQYAGMAVQSIAVGMQPSQPDSLLTKYREGVASRKGFELSGAYAAKGVMAAEPAYLDHCALYSTQDEWVLCVLRNPHHTCSGWEAALPAATPGVAAEQPTPMAEPIPSASPTPQTATVPTTGAVPDPEADMNTIPAPIVVQPVVTPAGDEVLVPGPTPLTAAIVNRTVVYFEWILGIQLAPPLRTMIRQSMVNDWMAGKADSVAGVQQMLTNLAEIEKGDDAMRVFVRETNQAAFVESLRADDSEESRAILQAYEAANAPLAAGDPPLTQEMADSFFDMLAFTMAVAQGAQPMTLSEENRSAWTRQLVIDYPNATPEQRAFISSAPLNWATLRAAWPSVPEPQKAALAEQWRTEFNPALAQGTVPAAPMQPAPTPTSSTPAPTGDTPTGDRTVDQLLSEILEAERREEEELMKTNPSLAIQKKMQNQAANAQLMSNMMKMSHDTSMAIISNMRS